MGNGDWNRRKDQLHKERKEIIEKMRPGMFSQEKMNCRDCKDEHDENKRLNDYEKWKSKNGKNMERFHEINRTFKQNRDEGLPHSLNDIRPGGKMKYD